MIISLWRGEGSDAMPFGPSRSDCEVFLAGIDFCLETEAENSRWEPKGYRDLPDTYVKISHFRIWVVSS